MRKLATFVTAAAVALTAAAPAPGATVVAYDAIPAPLPGNLASLGYEATSTSEFGGLVQLAATNGPNPVVSVVMSSWGCEDGGGVTCVTSPGASFDHPLTLNVYARGPGDAPGALLATQTKTFSIPYRPSAHPLCGSAWSPDGGVTCFNGKAVTVSFDALAVPLPDELVITIAYNTTHHGYAPIGEAAPCYTESGGCGYDSLNVGVRGVPTTGAQPRPSDAYLNSTSGSSYCDNGVLGTGSLRLDAGCWATFQPNFRIEAAAQSGPTGPTGATGSTGPPGVNGASGAAGPAGTVGAVGPAGTVGLAGPIGATGPAGAKGDRGPTGDSASRDRFTGVSVSTAQLRSGTLRLRLRCPRSAGTCVGRVRVFAGGARSATLLFDARAGQTVRVSIPLPASARGRTDATGLHLTLITSNDRGIVVRRNRVL